MAHIIGCLEEHLDGLDKVEHKLTLICNDDLDSKLNTEIGECVDMVQDLKKDMREIIEIMHWRRA